MPQRNNTYEKKCHPEWFFEEKLYRRIDSEKIILQRTDNKQNELDLFKKNLSQSHTSIHR
jgi:hypothetical protein